MSHTYINYWFGFRSWRIAMAVFQWRMDSRQRRGSGSKTKESRNMTRNLPTAMWMTGIPMITAVTRIQSTVITIINRRRNTTPAATFLLTLGCPSREVRFVSHDHTHVNSDIYRILSTTATRNFTSAHINGSENEHVAS